MFLIEDKWKWVKHESTVTYYNTLPYLPVQTLSIMIAAKWEIYLYPLNFMFLSRRWISWNKKTANITWEGFTVCLLMALILKTNQSSDMYMCQWSHYVGLVHILSYSMYKAATGILDHVLWTVSSMKCLLEYIYSRIETYHPEAEKFLPSWWIQPDHKRPLQAYYGLKDCPNYFPVF